MVNPLGSENGRNFLCVVLVTTEIRGSLVHFLQVFMGPYSP